MGEPENLDAHEFWNLGNCGNPYLWIEISKIADMTCLESPQPPCFDHGWRGGCSCPWARWRNHGSCGRWICQVVRASSQECAGLRSNCKGFHLAHVQMPNKTFEIMFWSLMCLFWVLDGYLGCYLFPMNSVLFVGSPRGGCVLIDLNGFYDPLV